MVNRVGDIGLSIAIMLMFATFGTLSLRGRLRPRARRLASGTLTAIGLLLLLGACGKSAQVPLQSWLGDAMEGPTPVSALIHAATMVTAGVYLIARSGAIFDAAPDAQAAVVTVGAVTLLFGAIIGCAKDDIKKALAGSTMSQIGYMVLAAGLGPIGYAFAIVHLLDPRLLQGRAVPRRRLGHARHERRGGHAPLRRAAQGHADHLRHLRPRLPRDHRLPAACPASSPRTRSSRPPSTRAAPRLDPRRLALLGAGITAFYMTRVMLMTFFGEKRWARGRPPARVAVVDDGPDDHAGRRLRRARRVPHRSATAS